MNETTKIIFNFIHDNLEQIHIEATKDTIYDKDDMAGIVSREYGFLIPGKIKNGQSFEYITRHATGDSGHGISFYQIDDRSYRDFLKENPLDDETRDINELVLVYAKKAIECLEEKRKYLEGKGWTKDKLGEELYKRAIFAAYNCGQGNVNKALSRGYDVDHYTYNKDYSKCVVEYVNAYKLMFSPENATSLDGINDVVQEPPMKALKDVE